ncbi:Endothelin-converting enzyme 2 [Madurella mycetomatis]|uniref:Endothelin-converting enzyme 2 n=1 Tax=Madurella mycetomatis TaxID=100816 RepID=A0A175W4S7_9PEZI|nr:Endothelin-converting enzyme 2 [Madurella mycetomatis]
MAASNDQALSHALYWDERYSQSDGSTPTHEWYLSFPDLEPFFERNIFASPGLTAKDDPIVLHLGSGDSIVPVEFAARGYKHQLCVDFSSTVVSLMSSRHAETEGIEWRLMDVRDMQGVDDSSVDLAFDKGTLDGMIYGSPWNPPQEVKDNTRAYLREVHRVLRDNGRFLYVTFRQPHFMKSLLNADGLWELDVQNLGNEDSFGYFGYSIRKALIGKPESNGPVAVVPSNNGL